MGAGSTYKPGIDCNAALSGRRWSFLSSFSGLKTTRLSKPGRERFGVGVQTCCLVKQIILFDRITLFEL